jgi:hypothetical protein
MILRIKGGIGPDGQQPERPIHQHRPLAHHANGLRRELLLMDDPHQAGIICYTRAPRCLTALRNSFFPVMGNVVRTSQV